MSSQIIESEKHDINYYINSLEEEIFYFKKFINIKLKKCMII